MKKYFRFSCTVLTVLVVKTSKTLISFRILLDVSQISSFDLFRTIFVTQTISK